MGSFVLGWAIQIEPIIKHAKEKRSKRKKDTKSKKDGLNPFHFNIMAYWINIGSRGQAVITAGQKT